MSWQTKRTMTPYNFKTALEALGLTQADAGRFLGLSARHIARMQYAEAEVPVPVALLLSSMIEHCERPLVPKGE